MIVAYIDEHKDRVVEGRRLGVEPIIDVLRKADVEIAPSSYYAAKARLPSARSVRDVELVPVIGQCHKDNIGVYRARKVWAELKRKDHDVARCTVERLMKPLPGAELDRRHRTTACSSGLGGGSPKEPIGTRIAMTDATRVRTSM